MGPDDKYSTNPDTNQEGFSQTTSLTATSNNYLTPLTTLSNPFPTGLLQASGNSLGLLTFAGQGVTFLKPRNEEPVLAAMEHRLSAKPDQGHDARSGLTSATTPCIFRLTTPSSTASRASTSARWARAMPTRPIFQTPVANPFSGLQTSQNTATTTPAQLLARYPEFPVGDGSTGWNGSGGVLEQNLNDGRSYFQSVNIRLQKRASHGLTFVFKTTFIRG